MRLSDEKIQEAFVSAGDESPIMRALTQLLSEMIESEVLSAIQPDLTDSSRAHNCGRAASLKDLSIYIDNLRAANGLTDQSN
jgi:hypothetical protein